MCGQGQSGIDPLESILFLGRDEASWFIGSSDRSLMVDP